MEVVPTRPEARRLVTSVVMFWLIGGAGAFLDAGDATSRAIGFVFVVVALVAGWIFYWTLFTVGGRSAGRSAASYLLPRGRGFGDTWDGGVAILLKVVSPGWWALVVRATRWPVAVTSAVLLGSFGMTLLSMAIGLG